MVAIDLYPEVYCQEVHLRSNRPADVIDAIKEAMSESRVVKLVPEWHISDLREFYNRVVDSLGTPSDIAEDFREQGAQTGERWMEIRYDADIPDLAAYRHSRNGQPLHTDESYISDPCDVMFFYAVNKAVKGGQTVFVDGPELVAFMMESDPDLLDRLSSRDVTYAKASNRRTEKIIDLSDPERPRFNYNYYCLDPEECAEAVALNEEFFEFLDRYVRGSYLETKVGLNPGEAVLWWDHLVLHGRNGFVAEKTNDRFIWKTGIQWSS